MSSYAYDLVAVMDLQGHALMSDLALQDAVVLLSRWWRSRLQVLVQRQQVHRHPHQCW